MINYKVIFVLIAILLNAQANAGMHPEYALRKERQGIKQYEKGKYKSAFNNLSKLAAWGYKDSQYVLAFMFLKGQHVEQSTLIGMAWLALAAESGREDWISLYDKLYAAASVNDKNKFDLLIKNYKAKFGMKAQRVTCSKRPNSTSNKIITACIKGDYFVNKYQIDLKEADIKL